METFKFTEQQKNILADLVEMELVDTAKKLADQNLKGVHKEIALYREDLLQLIIELRPEEYLDEEEI